MRMLLILVCLASAKLLSMDMEFEEGEALKVTKLFPENWIEYPCVEPGIPGDYVLGILQKEDHILWGKRGDIMAFALDPSGEISEPLFVVKHSFEVMQTGPNAFSKEKEIKDLFSKQGIAIATAKKMKWGDYPLFVIEGKKKDGKGVMVALIGLNSPAGYVISVTLITTGDVKHSKKIWDDFLHNTRPLTEQERFIAKGMDMRDGYTIYKEGGAKLKAIAEKRTSDRKLAVKVEAKTSATSFQILDIQEGSMDSIWKRGEPCVRIFGRLTERSKSYGTIITDSVITVLVKNVDRFSFDP